MSLYTSYQGIIKTMDEIDLLREQHKILSGEVALHMSALKRLSEEAAQNPKNEHLHVTFFNLHYSCSKVSLDIYPKVYLVYFLFRWR